MHTSLPAESRRKTRTSACLAVCPTSGVLGMRLCDWIECRAELHGGGSAVMEVTQDRHAGCMYVGQWRDRYSVV